MEPPHNVNPSDSRYSAIEALRPAIEEFGRGLRQVVAGQLTPMTHQVKFLKRLDLALDGLGIPGLELDCRQGCAYCCHYHVYITAEEALALAEFVKAAMTAEQRAHVKARLQENTAQVASMSVDQHIATNVKCAFLEADSKCLAYEARPLACRKHHSYNVASCVETFDDPSSTSQNVMSSDRQTVAEGFFALSSMESKRAGVDVARYEMSAAVLEALDNKASLRRWKDGKVSFPTVRDRDPSGGLP